MAVRADRDLTNALLKTLTVDAGQTLAVGDIAKYGDADGEVALCAAGEQGCGVVIAIGGNKDVTAGTAGDFVTVAMLAGACVLPVKVGTGGATRGKLLQSVSDGVTDVTPDGAPSSGVLVGAHGFATQNGSAGDFVGMVPAPSWVLEE